MKEKPGTTPKPVAGFILPYFKVDQFAPSSGNALDVLRRMNIPVLTIESAAADNLLPALYSASVGYDNVIIMHSDSEFYSFDENAALYENFIKYKADYGYGETHPSGVVFEIIRREALPVMENLRVQKKITVSRNIFHDIAEIDLNMFDIENLYSSINLRTHRLSFFSDTQQSMYTISRVKELLQGKVYNDEVTFKTMAEIIEANPVMLHTIPKYFELEITTECRQRCIFCPRTLIAPETAYMEKDTAGQIIEKITSFSDKPVFALSGMGDPLCHPDLIDIVGMITNSGAECIIETSGDGLTREMADRIIAMPDGGRVSVIFSIDASREDLYTALRPGTTPFYDILDQITYTLLRKNSNTWVQIVKMNENFSHLVEYHAFFEKYTKNIIIQKYNRYAGMLPERRQNPMEPFEKIHCWHLKRSMYIDVRGNVRMCKQDARTANPLGSLPEHALSDIFAHQHDALAKHISGGLDMCSSCDEYYTFTF